PPVHTCIHELPLQPVGSKPEEARESSRCAVKEVVLHSPVPQHQCGFFLQVKNESSECSGCLKYVMELCHS
ncbi:hypothetical protein P7K49_027669, partial [Saguinus oedipus]